MDLHKVVTRTDAIQEYTVDAVGRTLKVERIVH